MANRLYTIGGFTIMSAMIEHTWHSIPARVGAKWLARTNYPVQRGYCARNKYWRVDLHGRRGSLGRRGRAGTPTLSGSILLPILGRRHQHTQSYGRNACLNFCVAGWYVGRRPYGANPAVDVPTFMIRARAHGASGLRCSPRGATSRPIPTEPVSGLCRRVNDSGIWRTIDADPDRGACPSPSPTSTKRHHRHRRHPHRLAGR